MATICNTQFLKLTLAQFYNAQKNIMEAGLLE